MSLDEKINITNIHIEKLGYQSIEYQRYKKKIAKNNYYKKGILEKIIKELKVFYARKTDMMESELASYKKMDKSSEDFQDTIKKFSRGIMNVALDVLIYLKNHLFAKKKLLDRDCDDDDYQMREVKNDLKIIESLAERWKEMNNGLEEIFTEMIMIHDKKTEEGKKRLNAIDKEIDKLSLKPTSKSTLKPEPDIIDIICYAGEHISPKFENQIKPILRRLKRTEPHPSLLDIMCQQGDLLDEI